MKKTVKKTIPPVSPVPAIPELHIDAPLAKESIAPVPVIDEVMMHARRRWAGGIALFTLFIIGIGCVGLGYYKTQTIVREQVAVPTQTLPSPTVTPTPLPLRVAVWNGSGIAGSAGKAGEELKNEGFDVVEVSNAPSIQTGITLLLSPSALSREMEIKSALTKYKREVVRVEKLTTGEYDALIILGR